MAVPQFFKLYIETCKLQGEFFRDVLQYLLLIQLCLDECCNHVPLMSNSLH